MFARRLMLWALVVLPWVSIQECQAEGSETLLPKTTKGCVLIPDLDALTKAFDATQWGELAALEAMQPFAESLKRQLREQLSGMTERLLLTEDELESIAGGEVAVGLIQPGGKPKSYATVLIVNVTGRQQEAQDLLKTLDTKYAQLGSKKTTSAHEGVTVASYTMTREEGETAAHYFLHDDHFVASDHLQEAVDVIRRIGGASEDSLAKTSAFAGTIGRGARAARAMNGLTPHLRWFVEPFGCVRVLRAMRNEPRRRGRDLLEILEEQGFAAIQGVGGAVNLNTGKHQLVHRTFVFAPGEKKLAMRMLNFPAGSDHAPPLWAPPNVASFSSFNLAVKDTFEHSSTLIDALAGEKGVFKDVLEGVKNDPKGPQVDVRNEIVAHLEQRCIFFSDYVSPVGPESERTLLAIKTNNQKKLEESIRRIMRTGLPIKVRCYDGKIRVIYEVVEGADDKAAPKDDEPGGVAPFLPRGGDDDDDDDAVPRPRRLLRKNSAVAVAFGYLIVGNRVDVIKRVFTTPVRRGQALADQDDFRRVRAALVPLGSDADSMQTFSRHRREIRVTYELVRKGAMPGAETILARFLDRLFSTGKEDEARKPLIDGKKMPEFGVAEPYLSPAGGFIRSHDDGWLVTGVVLSK